ATDVGTRFAHARESGHPVLWLRNRVPAFAGTSGRLGRHERSVDYCNIFVPPLMSSLICIGRTTVPSGWNSILPPTGSNVLMARSSLRMFSPVIGWFFFSRLAIAFPVTQTAL